MNNSVIDIEIKESEPKEQSDNVEDNSAIDIPPLIDESEQAADDKVIFSDNDNMTAEDLTWNDENAVTAGTDKTPKSKYYIKWSNAYKEAVGIIYDKSSKPEDFKKAELRSVVKSLYYFTNFIGN